jgi:protein-tyrosine phosphatase
MTPQRVSPDQYLTFRRTVHRLGANLPVETSHYNSNQETSEQAVDLVITAHVKMELQIQETINGNHKINAKAKVFHVVVADSTRTTDEVVGKAAKGNDKTDSRVREVVVAKPRQLNRPMKISKR